MTGAVAGETAGGEPVLSGLVTRSFSNACTVQLDDHGPGQELEALLRGRFRQDEGRPLTGDRVRVRVAAATSAIIEEVLPRSSRLERPPVANVEQVLLVLTPLEPEVPLSLVDRILVHVERARLAAALAWNKSDMQPYRQQARQIQAQQKIYEDAGYPVFTCSAREGEGLTAIEEWLTGSISVLAGPSGVGKSSLLNALNPAWERRTEPVGSRRRRGRHVTRGVTLLPLAQGGWVADSPGFSRLNLDEIPPVELSLYFRDLRPHLDQCRFSECVHDQEPECGVKIALAAGRIAARRYDRYLGFLAETRLWEAERYD